MPRSALLFCAPILISLFCVTLLACGTAGAPGAANPDPTPDDEPAFGLTARTPLAPLAFPVNNPVPAAVDFEAAFPMLGFNRPVFLTAAPDGTNWIYVVEQGGRIYVFPNDDDVESASVFIDLSSGNQGPVSRASNEEGLLGLAFDPDYATNGRFYVHYSAAGPRRSVIARYTATFPQGQAPTANPNTQSIILQVNQPFSNHNAGMLTFGPDQMLYISMGDGGSGGDPQQHGQNLSTLLGAMLRIDVRNPPQGQPYGIPPDNPYVNNPNARDEIWAHGLRNPWRFSFDRDNGDLWLGDVGQGAREEINRIRRQGNYGWRTYEGNLAYSNPDNIPPTSFDGPVIDYGRGSGCTVVGGYVYRGQDVPSLRGIYVYADYCTGFIWGLRWNGQQAIGNTQIQNLGSIVSFGEDDRGELYAVSLNGQIRRFREPTGVPPQPFPARLSETGIFTDTASLIGADGFIEYDVNAELYADNAVKRRWIGVPGTAQIGFRSSGPWDFPLGTVLVKHFELALDVTTPSVRRRLETRVLIHEQQGWRGYTYRWNQAQTDADLLTGALDEDFTILDPQADDGLRTQTWTYPSRTDCLQCHTPAAGHVLGVRSGQLNRDFAFPEAVDNQLRTWRHIALFDTEIGDASLHPAWPDPAGTAPVAGRARAYLAANCAQCHLPNGPAPGNLDLRYGVPTGSMGIVNVQPAQGGLGLTNPLIVSPGNKESSLLWERMRRTDNARMPRLGSGVPHDAGIDLVGLWIDATAP